MARRKYPKQVSPALLLEFARQAVANAEAVAEEARILAAHERWPRATALMLLAREELAKGGYAAQLSISGMPLEKDSIAFLLGDRKRKLAPPGLPDLDWLCSPLTAAIDALSAARKLEETRIDSPEAEQLSEKLLAMTRPVVLAQLNADPAQRMGALVAEIKHTWSAMLDQGGIESLWRDALRVGISPDGESLLTPQRTDRAAYEEQAAAYGRMHVLLKVMLTDNLASLSMELVRSHLQGRPASPASPART